MQKEQRLGRVAKLSNIAAVEGLSQHEIATLVAVAENTDVPGDGVTTHIVRQDMEKSGFTKIAVTLSLNSLLEKGMLRVMEIEDEQNHGSYNAFVLTAAGGLWLEQNQHLLVLKQAPEGIEELTENDIPF